MMKYDYTSLPPPTFQIEFKRYVGHQIDQNRNSVKNGKCISDFTSNGD